MPELIIKPTEEQHSKIKSLFKKQQKLNIDNEIHSGFEFKLCSTDEGIAWLDLHMNENLDLGFVD